MKWKRTSWWVLITFFCFIIGPLFTAAPAQAATMADLVNEMNLVYNCIDDTYVDGSGKTDKDYMADARVNAQTLAAKGYADPDWVAILDPLINPMNATPGGQQALSDAGGETDARQTFVAAFADLSEIYYTSDTTELENRLNTFKTTYREFFQALLGNDITLDKFSGFLLASRDDFGNAVNHSLTAEEQALLNGKSLKSALLYGSNQELVDAMPILVKYSMENVIASPASVYADFDTRLANIGWSVDLLIDQFDMLNSEIDPNNKAEMGLALASVRSQSELFDLAGATPATAIANNAITCAVGDNFSIQLQIISTDIIAQVDYVVAGTNPTAITITNDQGNTIDFSATSAGTATLVLYRRNGVVEHDWITRLNVTVEGSAVVYGDVNGDTFINAGDIVLIARSIAGTYTLTANQQLAADVNGDTFINAGDIVLVARYIAGTLASFPVEP